MAKNTMPSAKAVLRMACTRIFVAAPGLRPTASEAFMPMKPTPRAEPKQASPMCRFPVISASNGVNILYAFVLFRFSRRLPRLNTVKPPKSLVVGLVAGAVAMTIVVMGANQQGEHRG